MLKGVLGHIVEFFVELFRQAEIWLFLFILFLGGALLIVVPFANINPLKAFLSLWWLWGGWLLFKLFLSTWIHWRQEVFKVVDFKWIMLEMRIPREVLKSPQAMEQVLRAFHSLRNAAGNFKETYIEGEITAPFSLEIVSIGGEIHFYVRCQKKQKKLVEAAFFSYYTDVEIVEVPDYVEDFPQTVSDLYERDWNLWGSEMVLSRDDMYPIKTYVDFENIAEEKQFDPISTFLEILGKLQKEERVGVQIIIAPAGNDWKDRWLDDLEALQTPKTMEIAGSEEGSTRQVSMARSPGQTDVLEKVEENLSKPAFLTLIRFVYLSPKSHYSESFARRGLVGAFNQYAALNLNSFRSNYSTATRTQIWNWPHAFPKTRAEYRKQRILHNYLRREIPPEKWMGKFITSYLMNFNFASHRFHMNVEGIATLFHPPTAVVLTAPHVKRVESRKTGPPAGLAIYGDEEQIDKFK